MGEFENYGGDVCLIHDILLEVFAVESSQQIVINMGRHGCEKNLSSHEMIQWRKIEIIIIKRNNKT